MSTTAAKCSAARSSKRRANSAATMTLTATAFLTAPCPARTRPAALIYRGTSRDRYARYTEESAPYVDNMERLLRKFETARNLLPRPVLKPAAKPARVGVIHYGSTAQAMDEAQALLSCDGLHVDTLRIRAFPLALEIAEFVREHEQVFVVEQNRDAQMRALVTIDLGIAPAQLVADVAFRRNADHCPIHWRGNRRPVAAPGFAAADDCERVS